MATSSTAMPERSDSRVLIQLKSDLRLLQASNKEISFRLLLLTSNVRYVRLISAVEDCSSVQAEGWHRRFRLEFLYVHIVLHMHL